MANRDLNFDQGEVLDVVPEKSGDVLSGVAEIGFNIAEGAATSKLLAQTAKAQMAFKQLDAEYRANSMDDPYNPDALRALQEGRAAISEDLGGGVSTLLNRKWQEETTKLATQSDLSNDMWATNQQKVNTVSNVNTAIKTNLDMANTDGRAFGAAGGNTDGNDVMSYVTAGENLHAFGRRTLGTAETEKLLKDFDADYVKSFVSGVAETSPELATKLLDEPDIKAKFNTEQRGDMLAQIDKTRKQAQMAQDLSVTVNNGELTDIVNDKESSYYEKRARIDELDMAGSISPSAAAKARRVLTSQEDLDTQTSTPVMADLVNKMYDLNSISETNSADYLRGVRNLQEEILEKQAGGELKAKDAMTLNKQLTGLTSSKLASATNSAGNEFYEANQTFKTLPPEYRGEATRQLFYAGDGQKFTKEQYKTKALGIVDEINAKRRSKAVETVSKVSADDATFLKTNKISDSDIAETMKIYKLTRPQVIAELRKRANKKKE